MSIVIKPRNFVPTKLNYLTVTEPTGAQSRGQMHLAMASLKSQMAKFLHRDRSLSHPASTAGRAEVAYGGNHSNSKINAMKL